MAYSLAPSYLSQTCPSPKNRRPRENHKEKISSEMTWRRQRPGTFETTLKWGKLTVFFSKPQLFLEKSRSFLIIFLFDSLCTRQSLGEGLCRVSGNPRGDHSQPGTPVCSWWFIDATLTPSDLDSWCASRKCYWNVTPSREWERFHRVPVSHQPSEGRMFIMSIVWCFLCCFYFIVRPCLSFSPNT